MYHAYNTYEMWKGYNTVEAKQIKPTISHSDSVENNGYKGFWSIKFEILCDILQFEISGFVHEHIVNWSYSYLYVERVRQQSLTS